MSAPRSSPGEREQHPPPDLAGIPVGAEGPEDLTVRQRKTSHAREPGPFTNPGPDDLAGIPVLVEAPEDLTVKPRRRAAAGNG